MVVDGCGWLWGGGGRGFWMVLGGFLGGRGSLRVVVGGCGRLWVAFWVVVDGCEWLWVVAYFSIIIRK